MEATTQILDMLQTSPHKMDIEMIRSALMDMLGDIKSGIQTRTPATELATRQVTQAMMQNMVKGEKAFVPAIQQTAMAQIAEAYSKLPSATPELGEEFWGLVDHFIRGSADIIKKQGLTNGNE